MVVGNPAPHFLLLPCDLVEYLQHRLLTPHILPQRLSPALFALLPAGVGLHVLRNHALLVADFYFGSGHTADAIAEPEPVIERETRVQ